MARANRHQRKQRRIFGYRSVNGSFIIRQMPAQQRAVDFAHRTLAELLAERGVDGLVARNHHQPGGAEIKTVRQRAAGKLLYQSIMYRVEIQGIFPRQAQQA